MQGANRRLQNRVAKDQLARKPPEGSPCASGRARACSSCHASARPAHGTRSGRAPPQNSSARSNPLREHNVCGPAKRRQPCLEPANVPLTWDGTSSAEVGIPLLAWRTASLALENRTGSCLLDSLRGRRHDISARPRPP